MSRNENENANGNDDDNSQQEDAEPGSSSKFSLRQRQAIRHTASSWPSLIARVADRDRQASAAHGTASAVRAVGSHVGGGWHSGDAI